MSNGLVTRLFPTINCIFKAENLTIDCSRMDQDWQSNIFDTHDVFNTETHKYRTLPLVGKSGTIKSERNKREEGLKKLGIRNAIE